MSNTPGAFVVRHSGVFGVRSAGFAVYNDAGLCEECCGGGTICIVNAVPLGLSCKLTADYVQTPANPSAAWNVMWDNIWSPGLITDPAGFPFGELAQGLNVTAHTSGTTLTANLFLRGAEQWLDTGEEKLFPAGTSLATHELYDITMSGFAGPIQSGTGWTAVPFLWAWDYTSTATNGSSIYTWQSKGTGLATGNVTDSAGLTFSVSLTQADLHISPAAVLRINIAGDSSIDSIDVVSGGANYQSGPLAVTIIGFDINGNPIAFGAYASSGDPNTPAAAEATVTGGVVTAVTVTSVGFGYVTATASMAVGQHFPGIVGASVPWKDGTDPGLPVGGLVDSGPDPPNPSYHGNEMVQFGSGSNLSTGYMSVSYKVKPRPTFQGNVFQGNVFQH
jgi:hypothetical protein